jgi:hypothetical protein
MDAGEVKDVILRLRHVKQEPKAYDQPGAESEKFSRA